MHSKMDKLEEICQIHYQDLLTEAKLLKINSLSSSTIKKSSNKATSLPFYASLLPLYEKLNHQELLLLEVEEQLKKKKQQNELSMMQQVLSNMYLDNSHTSMNPLKDWHCQMIEYCKKISETAATCAEDRLYYNVSFTQEQVDEGIQLMKLSFYTRHCKKCLMLTIEAKVNESCEEFETTCCRSSLGFENLLLDIKTFLENRTDVKEFVLTILWKHMKEIVDYL